MAWLDDHPPVRSQFRRPRREQVSGVIVVHTAESTPDFVAFDGGAEAVANFIRNRTDPGSYHELCDSDSAINLVGYDAEAYHDATGSNPHSFGVSAATRADVWPLAPEAWRNGCIANMAERCAVYARWVREQRGIIIPARRITREQSEARIPGFISHAERDPARRTDPGRWFPWDQFLDEYARRMGGGPASPPATPTLEDEMPYPVIACLTSDPQFAGRERWYALTPFGPYHVPNQEAYGVDVGNGAYKPVVRVNARQYDVALRECRARAKALADLVAVANRTEMRVVATGQILERIEAAVASDGA